MTPLEDIGCARATVPEDRAVRARRYQMAKECFDLAARLMVLACELDPDLSGAVASPVYKTPGQPT